MRFGNVLTELWRRRRAERRLVLLVFGLLLTASAALAQGSMGARGNFSDTLDALVELLGERARDALHHQDLRAAASAAKAVDAVLQAQVYASGNVSPQLITSRLIRDLGEVLR